jgi:sulfur carrier protein
MTVWVNGERHEVAEGATVASVLEAAGIDPGARGIAVAVDAEVAPRGTWAERLVSEGARLEVVTAIGGG